MAALGLNGVIGGSGSIGIRIELEQLPADESNIDPNQYFQLVQSADNRASIQLVRPIDFDVSYNRS